MRYVLELVVVVVVVAADVVAVVVSPTSVLVSTRKPMVRSRAIIIIPVTTYRHITKYRHLINVLNSVIMTTSQHPVV